MKRKTLLLVSMLLLSGCTRYQGKDQATMVITKSYDGNEVEYSLKLSEYDNKGNLLTRQTWYDNNKDNNFELYEQLNYTYDKKGNPLSLICDTYDEQGVKHFYSKVIMTYEDNKLVKDDYYGIDDLGNEYIDFYYSNYIYDEKGRLLSSTSYQYDDSENKYNPENKSTYTYQNDFDDFTTLKDESLSGNGFFDMNITRTFDDKGNILTEHGVMDFYNQLETFIYNQYGNVISDNTYLYDDITEMYHLQSMVDYKYVNRYCCSDVYTSYLDDFGNVHLYQHVENTFDKKGNLISSKEYECDYNAGQNEMKLVSESSYMYGKVKELPLAN